MNSEEMITKIANTYGYEAQSRQCMEEMAELTQALNKFWREELPCGKKKLEEIELDHNCHNIIEEMADAEIMLAQIKVPLKIPDEILESVIKLERQMERINTECMN